MILGRRVTSGRTEASHLTVLGRAVPLGRTAARTAGEQMLAGWLSAASAPAGAGGAAGRGAAPGGVALGGAVPGGVALGGAVPGGAALGGAGGAAGPGALGSLVGFGGGSGPLGGSEFLLAFGGQEADGASRARRWHVWGQGDVQAFEGTPSAAAGYNGALLTGYLGVDTTVTDRWLAGVALAHSRGDSDWSAGELRGALRTTLTAVHPYVQWSDGTTSVWATAGGGWGAADNQRASGLAGASDLGLGLGLVELRRQLGVATNGFEFALRGDAALAQLWTAAGEESIDGQTARVNQMRLGAEVSRALDLGDWSRDWSLVPFGEAHARRDGGAGQTGQGLELAGGLRLSGIRVRLIAQGRLLAVHSAAGYRERGAGLTFEVGSEDREGLSASVSPRWGDAATGTEALWQDQVYRRYRPAGSRDAGALDAQVGYGMRLPGSSLLTWFGSFSHSPFDRCFLIGGAIGASMP